MDQQDDTLDLIFHEPGRDDVEQEKLILEWMYPDKVFSRSIIRKQLALGNREAMFDTIPDYIQHDSPWETETVNASSLEDLRLWLEQQPQEVQDLITSFQLTPANEQDVDSVISRLLSLGVTIHVPTINIPMARPTIKQLLVRALPATQGQLYDLLRVECPTTKRPEATVRQFLRRHSKQLELIDSVYYWKGE